MKVVFFFPRKNVACTLLLSGDFWSTTSKLDMGDASI